MDLSTPLASPAARGRGLKLGYGAESDLGGASPAARGRGLKPGEGGADWGYVKVARRARAWIETACPKLPGPGPAVARRARAWIETDAAPSYNRKSRVARRARAWIET